MNVLPTVSLERRDPGGLEGGGTAALVLPSVFRQPPSQGQAACVCTRGSDLSSLTGTFYCV